LYKADACCTDTGTTTIACWLVWLTAAELLDEVFPPNVGLVTEAFPPLPPVPPLPLPMAEPPSEAAPETEPDAALPVSPLCSVELPPPATPEAPIAVGLAVAVDVDVEVGVDAPPVALEVAVLEVAPPAPAVAELEFAPAPPAPPVRLTDNELIAELD
jgi:hypothetical protein